MVRPLLLFAASCLVFALRAQVVVNEVSASNLNGLLDGFGEREDWVELYNPTGTAIAVGGWYLSNKPSNPTKWPIPAGATVPANGYLLFICSKRDLVSGGEYHTNFKLDQTDQDHVLLADPAGTVVDDFQFTLRTKGDQSRGRTTDGAATWSLFPTPTPGAANAGASPEYAPRPVLTPAAGFYGGPQNITITCADASATIRYTVDGSEPTAASAAYVGPVAVGTTTVVRAAAFSATPGVPSSFVETNTYFVGVSHTVPVVSVAGAEVADLFGGDELIEPFGTIEYFGEDQQLRDEATGQFNKHGNDSWLYDQRGVDYITRDQSGYNDALHYPIFRTRERDRYQRLILKAAANDNYSFENGAHIRDAYVHALTQTGGLRLDVRSYEPCVLYLNGRYWGVYELREKADDHDYTKEYYDQEEYDLQYLKTWGGTWSEYGGPQAQTDWDALRAFILSNDMGDPGAFATVDGQFNWKSLVDYVVLNSYTVCSDWLNWNTAWWRGMDPAGEHKKWGYTLWDNDATFGHYINYTEIPSQSPDADPCNADELPDPGDQGHIPILNKLMDENPQVHDYYINRYADLGNTVFSCDHMIPFLDSLVALIAPEMPRQISRWGGSVADWQSKVQELRDFITARCTDIQQGMLDCYTLTGPYNAVFNVDPPLAGEIRINSITPDAFPFQGVYYGGITTTLEATSAEGWMFDHWEFLHHTPAPGLLDSTVTFAFTGPDSIIAHFRLPTRYNVVVLVDPPGAASVTFDNTLLSPLPATVQVFPEDVHVLQAFPEMYYDFRYWEVKHNTPTTMDTLFLQLPLAFTAPDTVIAHLQAQDHAYYVPNAFTPDADGVNDDWRPINNVVQLETYDLRVFDRWGQEVFASTDPYKAWDGNLGGTPVPPGVYGFRAHVVDAISLEKHDVMGHVTVLR